MKKRCLGILLCMSLILTSFYHPLILKASGTTGIVDKTEVERHMTDGTYPSADAQVFAGWYEDEACTQQISEKADIPTAGAYPKFVDEKVLTVKGQLSKDATLSSEKVNLRLITAVNVADANAETAEYQKVGFTLTWRGKDADLYSTTVYRTLVQCVGENQESLDAKTVFGTDDATLFATKVINNIPQSAFADTFTVTPYWVTMDGTKVTGTVRTFAVADVLPIDLNVSLIGTEDTLNAPSEGLRIVVGGEYPTELIINDDEANAQELTLEQNSESGKYEAWIATKDIINDLKIGDNRFTVRVTRVGDDGQKHVKEETVTYQNKGFLYVRDAKGSLSFVQDGAQTVLQYTETTGGDWTGFGSRYISYKDADNKENIQGGFAQNGVKYISMQVKLVSGTGINLFYQGQNGVDTQQSKTVSEGETSVYLENRGVQTALTLNEWITVKIPLPAANAEETYRNFTVQPTGDNGKLYIREVKYHKEEYVAPITTMVVNTDGLKGNGNFLKDGGTDSFRVNLSESAVGTVIINGDESKAISLGTASTESEPADWNNNCAYYFWCDVVTLCNYLDLGENTVTVRATKTTSSGATLVSEVDFEYIYTGYLHINDASHTLSFVTDEETGEQILKYTGGGYQNGTYNGLRSNLIATSNQKHGQFKNKGIKYVTMEIKLTKATGLTISYENKVTANKIWYNPSSQTMPYDCDYIDDDGVIGKVEANKWITVKVPLAHNSGAIAGETFANFYIRPRGTNATGTANTVSDTEMYIRNVEYHTDDYVKPLKSLQVNLNVPTNADDAIEIIAGEAVDSVQVIVNGDTANPKTVTLNESYTGYLYMKEIINELAIGQNIFTVQVKKGSLTVERTKTYDNTGLLYVLADKGSMETITDNNETVLKFTANNKWDGVRSKWIANTLNSSAGNNNGGYAANLVKYMTLKVKLTEGTGIAIYHGLDGNVTPINADIIKEGIMSKYVVVDGNMQGALQQGQWVTLKIPLEAGANPGNSYRNFYFTTRTGDGGSQAGGSMLIKDVQYHTEDYVAPIAPTTIDTGVAPVNF